MGKPSWYWTGDNQPKYSKCLLRKFSTHLASCPHGQQVDSVQTSKGTLAEKPKTLQLITQPKPISKQSAPYKLLIILSSRFLTQKPYVSNMDSSSAGTKLRVFFIFVGWIFGMITYVLQKWKHHPIAYAHSLFYLLYLLCAKNGSRLGGPSPHDQLRKPHQFWKNS